MRRNRTFQVALIIAGMVLLFYIIIGLYLPSGRRLIVGVDKSSGEVRLVRQNVAFLPWHRYYRLAFEKRGDAAHMPRGFVRIVSKEGVPVDINYVLRFGITSSRLPDARRLVREGWSAWLNKRVGEAVSAVAAQVPIEDFASPNTFSRQRDRLRSIVARHLARSGIEVRAFEISKIEIDKTALLRYKRAELRRNARGTFNNVAVFAIDGADWELIQELIIDGRMPNVKALVEQGTSGAVATIQPTVSPLLWATAATGVSPDRHGVLDFTDRQQNGAPADARTRIVPAVWEIAEGFGRSAVVANWWTAWPPSTEGTYYGAPIQMLDGAVMPTSLQQNIKPVLLPEDTVAFPQVRRFLNITEAEYFRAMRDAKPNDPIVTFRSMLAKTWSDHRSAIELYRLKRPALLMVGYETTDFVNHLFAPYHPPYREGISQESFRKYWPAVANYYSEVDRMLGEWMRVLPRDTTVMIVSAHGMRWGKERPRTLPEGTSALGAHRNGGVFIAYGPQVMPSRLRRPLSIYDLAPTILALMGLPASREMPGRPVMWAFPNIHPITGVAVGSYQDLITRKIVALDKRVDPKVYRTRLQQIGHLTDPNRIAMPVFEDRRETAQTLTPERWGLYAHVNNTGITLKRQGKNKEAIEALEKAIELNPTRPTPYLNLAMALLQRQQFTAAEQLFVKAIALGLPNPEKYCIDFAAWYRAHDMPTRAITLLYKGRELFPQSALIASNLGSALASASRYTEALPELERALAIQPSSPHVLNNLGVIYLKKKEYARALDYWNRSLAIDPRQPKIREAATALQTRL